jgi:hypothetical protein
VLDEDGNPQRHIAETLWKDAQGESDATLIAMAPTMHAALVQAEDALAIKASLRAPEQARVQAALEAVRAALSAARPALTEGDS